MLLLSQLPPPSRQPSGGILRLSASAPVADHSSAMPRAAAHASAAAASETSALSHDARNLFSALHLYCDLLASPGVLAPAFLHYAGDLRVLGETGLRLVEGLAMALAGASPETLPPIRRRPFPGIDDLAAELLALEAPLRALAGSAVRVEVECAACAGRLALNSEDLLRILFNLVANSVEAMLAGSSPHRRDGFLRITAQRGGAASFLDRPSSDLPKTVVLSVRDNGPGIAAADLERVFAPGFTTRAADRCDDEAPHREFDGEPALCRPRGLGLAIVQQLAEAAGGTVRAVSSPGLGARFDIELPIFAGVATPPTEVGPESWERSDSSAKRIFEIPAAKRKRSVRC
jgi:signal transduction histidine kinase